ncbi:hypothetical protein BSKO_12901 [Bryopsis sp. KO-2023]|nr:hypothetical protein BSKO_12901 [Bryopsis sp. KO-2023]
METEGSGNQLYFLYGVTAVLLSFTVVLVGDRGPGLAAILFYVVFLSTIAVNFVDVTRLAGVLKEPISYLVLQGVVLACLGICVAYKKSRSKQKKEDVAPSSRRTAVPRGVEDIERALKRSSTPVRRPMVERSSLEDVNWCHLPDAVMGLILKEMDDRVAGAVRLVCKDWNGSATRSLDSLTPKEFHPFKLVESFPCLHCLDLSNCIEDVDLDGIRYLQLLRNLRELNLGRHHRLIASTITDDCIVQLNALSRLHTVNLSQCVHVSDDGLAVLAKNHPNLTSVNISGCVAVTERGIAELGRLKNLQHLELPWCLKVTDQAIRSLAIVPRMKSLNLSGCQLIHEEGVMALSSFVHLESLNLLNTGYSKPCVTDAVLFQLSGLKNLTQLSVGGMQLQNTRVSDNGLAMIAAHHPKLRNLCLMWLDVSDVGVMSLVTLTELRVLSLRGCARVTRGAIRHVATLPYLEDLNLLNMPLLDVTDDTVEELQPLNNLSSLGLGDMHMGNLLTDNGMMNLAGFNNLKSLSLAFFQWHFAGSGMAPLLKLANLKSIDLQGSSSVNDSTLSVIGLIKGITSLQLSRCVRITSLGMKHIVGLNDLESLSLSHCHRIDDTGMQHLGKVPSLTTLVLSGCNALTDAGLACLGNLNKLRTLDISSCEGIMGTGFESFENVPLNTLSLSGCIGVVDEGLQAVGKLLGLTKLDMCQCINVTDKGVAEGLQNLAQLTGLDVSSCHKVGDVSMGVLSRLPRLTTFRLGGCIATTDKGIADLMNLSGLLTVHLDRCYNLTDMALHSLGKCTRLTSLRLARCPQITDNGVAYLATLNRLSILSLAECPSVTDAGLFALAPLTALVSLEY